MWPPVGASIGGSASSRLFSRPILECPGQASTSTYWSVRPSPFLSKPWHELRMVDRKSCSDRHMTRSEAVTSYKFRTAEINHAKIP